MPDGSQRAAALPETIAVPPDRNGPIGSANGGVAAGLLGSLLPGGVRVRLYRPPPLARPMEVREMATGLEAVFEGEVAMSARTARLDLQPPPITIEEADAATAPFVGHTAVTCFVCGPDNPGGLHLFPGPVGAGPLHATTWVPQPWAADERGVVTEEVVWGALDCPGGVMLTRHYSTESIFPALGTMTAEIIEPLRAGDTYAIVAWPRGRDGRKLYAGTAILGTGGRIHGLSDQICIAMPFEWGGIA